MWRTPMDHLGFVSMSESRNNVGRVGELVARTAKVRGRVALLAGIVLLACLSVASTVHAQDASPAAMAPARFWAGFAHDAGATEWGLSIGGVTYLASDPHISGE